MSNLQILAVPVAFLLGALVGATGLSVLIVVALARTALKDALADQKPAADAPRVLFGVVRRDKRAEP